MSETPYDFARISASDSYSLPKKIFRSTVHWLSYTFILKSRKPREVKVDDLRLHVPPDVFHPGIFITSGMFAKFIRTLDLRGKRVVEVGTGSGILAISAGKAGASVVLALDINPAAVDAARKNADANGVGATFAARLSNLFSAVLSEEKFDVVISSPPSFEGEPRDMADRAWHAGPGYRDIRMLFEQAVHHLTPGGTMYLLVSSDTNVRYLEHRARRAGFDWKLVAEKSIVVESFLIFELRSAGVMDPVQVDRVATKIEAVAAE